MHATAKPRPRRRPSSNSASNRSASSNRSSSKTKKRREAAPKKPKVGSKPHTSSKSAPKDRLRITIIGGNEEVGRNMTAFEYGDDIVIIDMGLQWPDEDMPGIDYIVPNPSYLKGKEKNIRGVIFTHGHMDHIGAAPILLEKLGYPPIIGRDLTIELIKKKVEDYQKGSAKRLKTIRIKDLKDKITLGAFRAEFFEVEHSIMDAVGIKLLSPAGSIIHMGDWTITNEPVDPRPISYEHLSKLPKPSILMLESLGSLKKGLPPSETEVHENFKNLIKNAPGRIIIGTFASQIRRIAYILEFAEAFGKKVALEGYSMRTNMEIAKQLGYIHAKQDTFIKTAEIHKYPDDKVVVICTGAQGESNAALSRIVTATHRFITLKKKDTIVFASSVIPGNERSIQRLKDNLYRKCENVIHTDMLEIHISGHSTAQGMAEVLRQVKPTYFLPVYANHHFLKEAAKIAYREKFPAKNVFVLDNGDALEVKGGKAKHVEGVADTNYVFVDGLGVGDVSEVVLRDRKVLSADGMVVVIVQVDNKTGKLIGSPDIISRGFIFMKENRDLIHQTRSRIKKLIIDHGKKGTADMDHIKNQLRNDIGSFLFKKTERRPMILPVVIEV